METLSKIFLPNGAIDAESHFESFGYTSLLGSREIKDHADADFVTKHVALSFYPTKPEMLAAAKEGKWLPSESAAIVASYNPNTGTWKRGDWEFKVISTHPIIAHAFNGTLNATLSSKVKARIPSQHHPSQASHLAPVSHFEEMLDDHFEQDHADIFDLATNVPVYGQAYGAVRKIGGVVNDLFGKHEDKSATGFNAAQSSMGSLPYYPTRDEMLKALQTAKMPNGGGAQTSWLVNYDPSNGTFQSGDWKFLVTSVSPIKFSMFKGAKERNDFTSTVNAQPPANMKPVAVPATSVSPVTAINAPSQANASVTTLAPATPGLPKASQSSTPTQTSNAPIQQQQQISGAADLSAIVPKGGTTTYIIMGALVLAVIVILVVAMKK